MFKNFGYEVSKIFKCAENEMLDLKHPYVGSEHLLLSLLKYDGKLSKKLEEYGLTYKSFKNELLRVVGRSLKSSQVILYTPLLKRVIDTALEDAKETNDGNVTAKHLLMAILEEGEGIAIRVMIGMDIEIDNLYRELCSKEIKNNTKNLQLFEIGTLLNDYVNLNDTVIGREQEIDNLIETLLRKNKNNPLLIGKAGVGKTAIIEELTRKIIRGEVPGVLKQSKIVMLEMGSLVAGTKYRGEFEERLTNIIKEVMDNKDIILFIDEIHTMVNAGGAEGAINAGDIFKPYLARGDIKCIGATTIAEYNKYIAKDKALERRFEIVDICEPNVEETKIILNKIKSSYEKHHDVKIPKKVADEIVRLANKYIHNKNNPDKCIDVLDSVCAKAKSNIYKQLDNSVLEEELNTIRSQKETFLIDGNYEEALSFRTKEIAIAKEQSKLRNNMRPTIRVEDIYKVIENKTNVPIMENKEDVYSKIESNLYDKIIGQKSAIDKILNNFYNKLFNDEKPLSLLLIGPTGVGKTESVKVVSDSLSKKNTLIRLDMSEYNLDTSVNKLIGTSAGYIGYDDEYIFNKVKRNPYSVILVDEIEKAHPKVLNLFLQILDEGCITDNKGEKINFNHTFIFMTSNIKTNNAVGFSNSAHKDLEEILSKELIGRFDDIIEFRQFDDEDIRIYVDKYCKDKKIKLNVDEVIKKSDYKNYGLRNVKNILRKENKVSCIQ